MLYAAEQRREPALQDATALVAVAGASGIGKTAAINWLIANRPERYERPQSFTSRAPRPDEGHEEYDFLTKEEILSRFRAGELLNLDDVHGNLYAISSKSTAEIVRRGRVAIKEVHFANHEKLRKSYPQLISTILLDGDGKSVRCARERAGGLQADCLSNESIAECDVIRYVYSNESVADVAESLDVSISAVATTCSRFPRPRAIDLVNAKGYSLVAPEFLDGLRITTENFHDLSVPFLEDAILQYVHPGSKCLEIGPGSGWLRRRFQLPGVEYTALDISAPMLTHIAQGATAGVVHAPARAMPFPPASFDLVFALLGDGYCYPAALCEIRRVLRHGGHLILTSPAGEWATALRDPADRDITTFALQDGTKAKVYSFAHALSELEHLVRLGGLQVTKSAQASGSALPADKPVSPAVSLAARNAGLSIAQLPIVNLVVAARTQNGANHARRI